MSQKKEVIVGVDGKPMYELITKPHAEQAFMWQPVYGGTPLFRVGFLSPVPPRHLEDPEYIHDSRPIAWPLYHPYWIVRMSHDANMMMAYVESIDDVTTFWPEATEITVFENNALRYGFNANFQEPSWLKEVHAEDFKVAPRKIGAFRIFDDEDDTFSILGFSDDLDYAIQLNNHKLEYGVHPSQEFQAEYKTWETLTIEIYPTANMDEAKARYEELVKFHTPADLAEGGLPTNFKF